MTTQKTAPKTAKRSIASKPTKKEISAALEAQTKDIPMVSAYTITANSKAPYKVLQSDHSAFRAHTIAAFIVGNAMTLSAAGTPGNATGKPQAGLIEGLIRSAYKNWIKLGRLDDNGALTVKGKNEITASFAGTTRGYNTTIDTVKAIAAVMAKGGKVEINGRTYEYGSKEEAMKV